MFSKVTAVLLRHCVGSMHDPNFNVFSSSVNFVGWCYLECVMFDYSQIPFVCLCGGGRVVFSHDVYVVS